MPSPSDVAYERVRDICLRFPAAEEKISHGAPSFHVRGKTFLTFVDNHHGDGRLAVWCKATTEEQRRLVASDPVRFFVPPYVGVKGHGDGTVSACVKGSRREQARAIAADPKRYHSPAYIGSRGYLGIRLDTPRVDWKDVSKRLEAAYRSAAPKALASKVPAKRASSR
jgi:hypothetical protein